MMAIPVPVYAIAEALVDILEEKPLDVGRDGMVVQSDGMTAIRVNSLITSRGRKRFTVAHELGHVGLHEGTFECLSRNMGLPSTSDWREREANEFAAEMLMPEREFRSALGNDIPSFETIVELSDQQRFHVSLMAAALRAVNVTDHQCLLVVSQNGEIEWTATSNMFPVYTRRCGSAVPRASATRRAAKEPPGAVLEDEQDACTWLDDRRIGPDEVWFEEEAVSVGEGRVMTLLTPSEDLDFDTLETGQRTPDDE